MTRLRNSITSLNASLKPTVLFESSTAAKDTTITLTESYKNFEILVILANLPSDGGNYMNTFFVSTYNIASRSTTTSWMFAVVQNRELGMQFTSDTSIHIDDRQLGVYRILGYLRT